MVDDRVLPVPPADGRALGASAFPLLMTAAP